jgi:hypothetical protein
MRTHFLASAVAAALALTTPAATLAQTAATTARASYVEPLTPENSYLILVDLQDMFGLTIGSIDQTVLLNNAIGVTRPRRCSTCQQSSRQRMPEHSAAPSSWL